MWAPEITVLGIKESHRAPGSSSQDTDGDQNSGVIWRGSSGRMLTESSARPQSRHSMVYSWGRKRGGWKKGGCHSPAPPQGNLSQIRYPIPDCNQSQGISFPAPLAPLSPFSSHLLHRRCARNEEWGSQAPAITHIPMPGELGFPHKAQTSAGGTPGSPGHRDEALNPSRLCPREGGNQPVEGWVWNSRSRVRKGFWGTRHKPGSHPLH